MVFNVILSARVSYFQSREQISRVVRVGVVHQVEAGLTG